MRRATVRAFRTARLAPLRSVSLRSRTGFQSNRALGIRYFSGQAERTSKSSPSKAAPSARGAQSMYIRRFSVAVVSGLVGYGAWYAYRGNVTDLNKQLTSVAFRGFSNTGFNFLSTPQSPPEAERRAVIVGADSLYTGAITEKGPLSKPTDDAGRRVLEMLTPEQATQKLRRNEESYLVGRGKGVVRYDVVQIPSNDPIEDDHSEKIVEVPTGLAGAHTKGSSSDWMFWGVFDGHA